MERGLFGVVERQWNCRQSALTADQMGQCQGHARAIGNGGDSRADRENGSLVMQDDVHNTSHGTANAVIGRSFSRDNLVSGAANIFINLLPVSVGQGLVGNPDEFGQVQPGNGCMRPCKNFGVSVFTEDVSMDM